MADDARMNQHTKTGDCVSVYKYLKKISDFLDHIGGVAKWLNVVAVVVFFLMICMTFVDVLLRYVFNSPLMGIKEYTEVLLVLMFAFAVCYTYNKGGHIRVDLITSRMSGKLACAWDFVTVVMTLGLSILVAWQCVLQSQFFVSAHKIHGTVVHISTIPFQIALTLGFFMLTIMIFRDCLRSAMKCIEAKFKALQWVVIAVVLVGIFVVAYFWMQPEYWAIDKTTIALISIIVMLILMFSGMPLGLGLMLTGLLMLGHLRGLRQAMDNVTTQMFATTSNYTWAVVGFFIMMGFLCLHAKFGEGIYATVRAFVGRVKGGLAIVTIGASTAMGGIVGDSMSVAATMSSVGLPQMREYGYKDKLSIGTIAAGSTLGPLIPPSTTFIIYASLTGQSVGRLFVAGIIPGLVLAAFFIATIRLICRFDPAAGPPGPKSTRREKISSLRFGGPIVFLFLLVIGGIYAGIFTAIEGGAIGCIGALLIGLVLRRWNRKNFIEALLSGVAVFGMIFLIIVGANIFSSVLAWCNLTSSLSDAFSALTMSPKLIALLVVLGFYLAGFFIDIMPLILIGIPIFHPILMSLGLDATWVTVLIVMAIQSGVISPPFATILFGLQAMNPDIPIGTIFRGAVPFVVATILGIVLLFLIPSLITWLPGLLY
jgi:tripartite ATP-independent transporter DctM subunit